MKKFVLCIISLLLIVSLGFCVMHFLSKDSLFALRDLKEEDISFDDNKINLYLFYGDGCPHCEELLEYLNTLPYTTRRKINLYTFEVWYNEDSYNLFMNMGEKLDIEMKSIPFLFVGDTYFEGFRQKDKKEIKKSIEEYVKNTDKKDLYKEYLLLKTE